MVQQLDFNGRVALVTGAGSGMGRAYALMLASRGARVVVNDINPEGATETVASVHSQGGEAVADTSDICRDAAALVHAATETFGGLDIVINNAGIQTFGMFAEQNAVVWWKIFDTHFRGTVEVTRHAWPWLVASGTGRVVNTGSSAMLPGPNRSAYGAAKAAIWGLSNSIAPEGREAGILVNTILPSSWTPMTEASFDAVAVRDTMRDLMPASAVAAFVTWLVHQDTTVHGECFQISGNAAGRARFAGMLRVRAGQSTPESWAEVEGELTDAQELVGYETSGDSLTRELLLHNPALNSVLSTTSVSLRAK